MAFEILQREDLSVYLVAGVPRGFEDDLCELVQRKSRVSGAAKIVDNEGTEWVIAKLRENGRRRYEKTAASAALWRAYRALSAAKYHLQDPAAKDRVQALREQVECLWNAESPVQDCPDGG